MNQKYDLYIPNMHEVVEIHLLIHSDHFYSVSSSPFLLISAPTQHGYCAWVSRRSATGNCEL